MVKPLVLLGALATSSMVRAQEAVPYTGAGLLRASAAISPGFLFDGGTTNIYLGGKLEYFPEDRISFRGDGFWYVNSQQKPAPPEANSQVSFGPFLHSIHGRLDLSAGVQAGVSFVKPANEPIVPMIALERPVTDPLPMRIVPTMALCGSLSYAVWDYFHFFVDLRLLRSRYEGGPQGTIKLDEAILSAGLGWQFRLHQ